MLLLSVLPLWILLTESYNNNTVPSPEYMGRFTFYIHPMNASWRGLPRRQAERILYWGSNLWTWQHWVRKGLFYFLVISVGVMMKRVLHSGSEYVTKAVFNREKDLVFVWRVTGLFRKQMHVYELHYLEQTVPKAISSWKHLGNFQNDGIFTVHDLRLDHSLFFYNERKYWNIDERDHFFKNTTTFWRGLRHKDVDKGIFINRSSAVTEEDYLTTKKIQEEIKDAVAKHGPIAATDYDYNYKYQLKKRIQDIKRNLIEGKSIDTSHYREHHEKSENIQVKHALH